MATKSKTARQAAWQGSKWITPVRRLGIYCRDGFACVWCGAAVEDLGGVLLSLDHVKCHVDGGGNESDNLVTACKRCNSSRGSRSVTAFARAVAAYLNHGIDYRDIVARVRAAQRRKAPTAEAKILLARRGTISRALASR